MTSANFRIGTATTNSAGTVWSWRSYDAPADIASGSYVKVELESTNGVRTLTGSIPSADGTTMAAGIPAVTTVQSSKTVTFQAGTGAPRTYLVRAVINSGSDLNGDNVDDYIKQLAVHIKTGEALKLLAVGETNESNRAYGYTGKLNETALTVGAAAAPNGTEHEIIQYDSGGTAVSTGIISLSQSLIELATIANVAQIHYYDGEVRVLGGNGTLTVISGFESINFSSYGIGAGAPTGWTDRWTDVSAAWAIKALGGATGGQVLEELSNSGFSLLSLDAIDGTLDSDIKIRCQYNGTQIQNYICIRGSGDTTLKQGYLCAWHPSGQLLYFYKVVAGVSTAIATAAKTVTISQYYCMRIRSEGSDFKLKLWVGDYGDEPGSWDIETSDGAIPGDGWIGVGGHRSEATVLHRFFDRFDYAILTAGGFLDSELPDQTQSDKFNAFGNLIQLQDDTWFVVYRKGHEHVAVTDKGEIWGNTSVDGYTWDTEFQIHVDPTYDLRDPIVTQLSNGDLIMQFFKYDHPNLEPIVNGNYVIKASSTSGPWTEYSAASSFTGWEACCSQITELPNGDLLMASYGIDTGDGVRSSRLVKSTDLGLTWSTVNTIADGTVLGYQCDEPWLLRLDTGDILCTYRDGSNVYQSSSTDDGATWGASSTSFTGTGSPRTAQFSHADGGLVVINYRGDTSNETAYRWSTDRGVTWSAEQVLTPVTGSSHQYGSWTEQFDASGARSTTMALCYWRKNSGSESFGYVKNIDFSEHATWTETWWIPEDWGTDRGPDFTADDVFVADGKVSMFIDQNTASDNHAVQTTAALQGSYVKRHPALGFHAAVRMNNNDGYYDISAMGVITDFGLFCVADHAENKTGHEYLIFRQNSLALEWDTHFDTGLHGFYDGSHKTVTGATVTTGSQSLLWSYDSTGTTGTVYRDGSSLGTVTLVSQDLNNDTYILGGGADTNDFQDTYFARLTFLKRVPTSGDRSNWFTWSTNAYETP